MLPYGRQSIDDDDVAAVVAALRSDWLTTGPAVAEFEAAVSAACGDVPAVSVTSGTAALHVAYAAAGVGPGDEVVTTPLTFVATAAAAALHGATVVFADVEPDTGNLDVEAARAAMTERTRVVAAVDYAGLPAEPERFAELAHAHGALFLEDAAHSIGSRWAGRPVGAFADLTTLSFFPTKNLTTAEGGAVLATDPGLERRARLFKNHGLVREPDAQRWPDEGPWHQEVHELGLNYRLPDVLAALGTSQLRRLDAFRTRRAEIHARYDEGLRDLDGVRTPAHRADAEPAWHLYPLRVLDGRRREVFESLRAAGIGVQVNYIPAYWHPAFADLGYRRGLCPNAEAYYEQEISLPLFPDLTDADVDRVVEEVRRAVTGR
ncbi:UDP-4-amino-4,6-dideoxy-N-acetyl-beta-L-altrosamine transaminase [Cellulomonas carbonis]|uniref:Aminotransferase DegT n=1 Tax=Cellulomonas carbonis T26 TaxID=947969 RepID=A0A0A0BJY3_9CELL|nr:UDP-4-amino-4,6-dideoxy-N-acetyl-beta-L-altrosamine transaminase [Cellulomonas carbonis]KGM08823.1 aminotransferase DegT [Cellulomonas carbonis T26]GGC11375.1 UDP-4-amino-4,6-dideoxy-N-acetyl-beta-L-altrosamine transaminase [Cellulomonas carbonis]